MCRKSHHQKVEEKRRWRVERKRMEDENKFEEDKFWRAIKLYGLSVDDDGRRAYVDDIKLNKYKNAK